MNKNYFTLLSLLTCLFLSPKSEAQSCLPTFLYGSDSNMITQVQFATINNSSPFTSGTTPQYEDFTAQLTTINAGSSYPISVKGPSSTFPSDIVVYIDFNQNGSFADVGESFYIGRIAPANPANANTITATIEIPATALSGSTKMRILKNTNVDALSNPNAANSISGPCANLRAGQTEEYSLIINTTQTCGEPGPVAGDLGCIIFNYSGSTKTLITVRGKDGKVWLQQNLGSSNVATSATDADAYGDTFQWGRWDDGHQSRTSSTSSTALVQNNPAGLNGGNPSFLTESASWWGNGVITDNWDKENPANVTAESGCDPCKALGNDWSLPTQADWQAIITAEEIINIEKAFTSNLKLTVGGNRTSSGSFNFVGQRGYYWSKTTTTNTGYAKYLYYSNAIVNAGAGGFREQGSSIRCLKESSTLGIGNFKKPTFKLYPNPTSSFVTIQNDLEIKNITIYNQIGQLISSQKNTQVDLSNASSGIYLLHIDFENGQKAIEKIIKK